MGSSGSKSTSSKHQMQVKGKESKRKEMKPLDTTKQSNSESGSHAKKDRMTDVEMSQTDSWISNQEFKRSRDLMKISKSALGKKTKGLLMQEKREKSINIRRQRDRSLKAELPQRMEITNPLQAQTKLKKQNLRNTMASSKSKDQAVESRNMNKNNDNNNLNGTKKQLTKDR
uniref:PAPA-1 domain-containing protein n=1 Tax=Elaeophora elaphi TaxID=1147741 RepID=A0A0R3RG36_9BILA